MLKTKFFRLMMALLPVVWVITFIYFSLDKSLHLAAMLPFTSLMILYYYWKVDVPQNGYKTYKYWVPFTVLTCGIGAFVWLAYLIAVNSGTFDPNEVQTALLKRFSNIHNSCMVIIIFYTIIFPNYF